MSATFELFRDDAGCYRFYRKSAIGDTTRVSLLEASVLDGD